MRARRISPRKRKHDVCTHILQEHVQGFASQTPGRSAILIAGEGWEDSIPYSANLELTGCLSSKLRMTKLCIYARRISSVSRFYAISGSAVGGGAGSVMHDVSIHQRQLVVSFPRFVTSAPNLYGKGKQAFSLADHLKRSHV